MHSSTVQSASILGCNVLIVGGGPAGFAAALMLAKRGWSEITVVEKRSTAQDYEPDKSFNYMIDGRGQKFTDLLEITDKLAAIGVPSSEFYLTRIEANGDRKTLKVPLIDSNRKTAYWVPRRAFVQMLYQEIQQHWTAQITVRFNTRCTAINKVRQWDGERLEVTIEGGEPDSVQRLEPRLLIGCDGVQSIVRSTLNTWDQSGRFEMQSFPSPSSGLRYKVLSLPPNFPLDAAGKEQTVSTMSYAIRGAFRQRKQALSLGLLPLKDPQAPRTANLVNRPDHYLWQLKTGEAVQNFLERAFPQLPMRQILSPEEADRFAQSKGGSFPTPQFCSGLYYRLSAAAEPKKSIRESIRESTHEGTRELTHEGTREGTFESTHGGTHEINSETTHETTYETASGVLLLGDAIHCFPPDIGQGVNSALEDVVVLHQVLAEEGDDWERSLSRYEQVRSPDVHAVVRLVQVAAPWQYRQDWWRGKLWAIGFAVRLGLSKVLPWIHPPAFFLVQNHQLSYQEIWRRTQSTTRILIGMGVIGLAGLLGIAMIIGSIQ
ncbi:MAG: FAD-dependent monooxygenase [Oculatellaceae cyanobacterium Prado106]|jgi:2-polyprenyl-6-methoxyphenol hydroxylase-like FAD-dependent oxidoreductase|nr:FAD-dependent monooxygenase [Oculatellaceae cyanobacterium Prado106]